MPGGFPPSPAVLASKAFVPDLPLRGSSGFTPDSLLGARRAPKAVTG
jgi:hypothetical protein